MLANYKQKEVGINAQYKSFLHQYVCSDASSQKIVSRVP